MKIKLLMTGIFILASLTTFAQKGELKDAQDAYQKYDVTRASKFPAIIAEGVKDLNDAKTSIDKAAANEKTSGLPLTWALKGAIYSSLALNDTVPATSLPLFNTADEALKQAKVLDSAKHENKDMIKNAYLNLAQYQFNKGRVEFQNKNYDAAYKSFDYFYQVLPDDTLSMYVTGLAAANAGTADPKYYPIAITQYTKLLNTNYSQIPQIYYDLTTLYLDTKDTTSAFKIAGEGVAKYPADNDLRTREIEIGLQSGKQNELLSKVQAAINNDPKNKTLYYYEGLTYSQIAEAYASEKEKTKDATQKSSLNDLEDTNFQSAADQYKKALAIDSNYFEANLNMGYVIIKPAIDAYNAANQLPANQQKQYDAAIKKAEAEFDMAKPYLQKAVDLNPKSVDALNNLKTYYLGKGDTADANVIQKKIDALGGN